LIVVAALFIGGMAVERLANPTLPEAVGAGAVVAAIASAINYLVARVLLKTARAVDSIVLEADGHHLMSDVWTSIGVILGLVLVKWTKIAWLDPVIAILVAVNIVRIGLNLVRRSFDGLMDRALDDSEIDGIRAAIESHLTPEMTYHALRTRRAGSRRFADYHLLVPGEMNVTCAHDHEMEIERAIELAVPGIEVTSHIEPVEEPRAWNDSRVSGIAALAGAAPDGIAPGRIAPASEAERS
jgi:cation diffusion facilitator family transporter